MSYLELLETAKERLFNRYAEDIKDKKTDGERYQVVYRETENLSVLKLSNIMKNISKIKKPELLDELKKAQNNKDFDIILKASLAVEEELKTSLVEIKKKELLESLSSKHGTTNPRVTMQEIIRNFSNEKIYAKVWKEKTQLEHKAVYDRFFTRLTIMFPSEVTPEKLRSHKDWLMQQGLTPQTVNKNLSRIENLLKWAVSQGFIHELPTTVTIRVQCNGKTDQNREALSNETLKRIFHSDFYTAPKKGFTFDYAYQYWIPLIALFSGMRINEVCQLYCDDIISVDNEFFFDINANTPDKSIKTKSSKRLVPIHSSLIELGFLEFVDMQRKMKHKILFSDLTPQRDGYGHYASRWYNGKFKPKLGVTKRYEDFHAFRHTFTTRARESGYPIEDIQGIVGHSNETITGGIYGKTANLRSRHVEVVKNIKYDLDLNKVIPFSKYPFRNGRNKNKKKPLQPNLENHG